MDSQQLAARQSQKSASRQTPARRLQDRFNQEGEKCKSLFNCSGNLKCCYPYGEYDEGTCKYDCNSGNQNQQGDIGYYCERQANCKSDLVCCIHDGEKTGFCRTSLQCPVSLRLNSSATDTFANQYTNELYSEPGLPQSYYYQNPSYQSYVYQQPDPFAWNVPVENHVGYQTVKALSYPWYDESQPNQQHQGAVAHGVYPDYVSNDYHQSLGYHTIDSHPQYPGYGPGHYQSDYQHQQSFSQQAINNVQRPYNSVSPRIAPSDDEDDAGLDTGAWVGIGFAIACGVLILAYICYRCLRQKPQGNMGMGPPRGDPRAMMEMQRRRAMMARNQGYGGVMDHSQVKTNQSLDDIDQDVSIYNNKGNGGQPSLKQNEPPPPATIDQTPVPPEEPPKVKSPVRSPKSNKQSKNGSVANSQGRRSPQRSPGRSPGRNNGN